MKNKIKITLHLTLNFPIPIDLLLFPFITKFLKRVILIRCFHVLMTTIYSLTQWSILCFLPLTPSWKCFSHVLHSAFVIAISSQYFSVLAFMTSCKICQSCHRFFEILFFFDFHSPVSSVAPLAIASWRSLFSRTLSSLLPTYCLAVLNDFHGCDNPYANDSWISVFSSDSLPI